MRAVIQRVTQCELMISQEVFAHIENGLTVLLGYSPDDDAEDIKWIIDKIMRMRIFADTEGKMNLSVSDTHGEVLLVSQFTLYASTKKGNRPSFTKSADPEIAEKLYHQTIAYARVQMPESIYTGKFGADMQLHLINDGPVTIILDSKNRM